jgi:hypothetical protein
LWPLRVTELTVEMVQYLLSVKDRGAGNVSIEWLLVGRDNVNMASSGNEVQQNKPKETRRSILVSVGLELVYGWRRDDC